MEYTTVTASLTNRSIENVISNRRRRISTVFRAKERRNRSKQNQLIEIHCLTIQSTFQRYWYYITKVVQSRMVAPQHPDQYQRFCSYLTPKLTQPSLADLHDKLKLEIQQVYDLAIRQAVVDYILLDPSERKRVKIFRIPKIFRSHTIRAPIEWHDTMNEIKRDLQITLHANNPIMSALQVLWDEHYAHQRLISFQDLTNAALPMVPQEFEKFLEQRVNQMRKTLSEE